MWKPGRRYQLNLPDSDYETVIISIIDAFYGKAIEVVPKPVIRHNSWTLNQLFRLTHIEYSEWVELPDKSENFTTLYDKLNGE